MRLLTKTESISGFVAFLICISLVSCSDSESKKQSKSDEYEERVLKFVHDYYAPSQILREAVEVYVKRTFPPETAIDGISVSDLQGHLRLIEVDLSPSKDKPTLLVACIFVDGNSKPYYKIEPLTKEYKELYKLLMNPSDSESDGASSETGE